jgi:hypothetical protein
VKEQWQPHFVPRAGVKCAGAAGDLAWRTYSSPTCRKRCSARQEAPCALVPGVYTGWSAEISVFRTADTPGAQGHRRPPPRRSQSRHVLPRGLQAETEMRPSNRTFSAPWCCIGNIEIQNIIYSYYAVFTLPKVAGSIPYEVIAFQWLSYFKPHYDHGFDSASNKN